MALFTIYCTDKPNHVEMRLAHRSAHLDYLKGFADQTVLVGPLLSPDGQSMIGSLVILDLPDLKAAYDWVADDPYGKAGLFESIIVRPLKKVLPA